MNEGDRLLVDQLLAGNRRAFETCFAEYFPKLYRFALRRLNGDMHAAEDTAQATLCRAFESLRTYRGEATLFTWLCTLCRHEMTARYRMYSAHAARAPSVEDDPEVRAALESLVAGESFDPALAADSAQLREAVLTALDYVSPLHATILEWKYVQDLPVGVIAGRIGRSPKATESLLTRARCAFREAFSLLYGSRFAGA